MSTDALENLFLEETRAIRSVKRQLLMALAGIAKGVSAEGLGQALMKLLESTEHHVERLDRIFGELREALGVETVVRPSIAHRIHGELERTTLRAGANTPENYARLTSREAEVLQLIAEGYANKQMAAELGISKKTVEKHRQNMMAKLGLHDTAGVTRYAISAGIVDAVA